MVEWDWSRWIQSLLSPPSCSLVEGCARSSTLKLCAMIKESAAQDVERVKRSAGSSWFQKLPPDRSTLCVLWASRGVGNHRHFATLSDCCRPGSSKCIVFYYSLMQTARARVLLVTFWPAYARVRARFWCVSCTQVSFWLALWFDAYKLENFKLVGASGVYVHGINLHFLKSFRSDGVPFFM